MKVEVHKVVTISHDEASLCAQNAQNARGAEGNKVFPGFARDNLPAFQLGTTRRRVQAQGMVEHCSWCLVDFTCDEIS